MDVVSSCREMLGKVPQRAQPLYCVATPQGEDSQETAVDNTEEGGEDVKSSRPLCPGLRTRYKCADIESQDRKMERSANLQPSSDRGLQCAHVKLEWLVIADQKAAVSSFPSLVHTASHHTKVSCNRCPVDTLGPKLCLVIGV